MFVPIVFALECSYLVQAVEVRVGQQGVKAKWVRVELRKVETLPGGTPNTFMDYVGPSPVTLWQANEEYGMLQTVSAFVVAG